MKKQVIFTGVTAKGLSVVLRYPLLKDASGVLQYINRISSEQTFMRMQGEQRTLPEQKKFLKEMLTKIEASQMVRLLVFSDQLVIGSAGIELGDSVQNHVGCLHLSVAKDYREKGVGSLLLELLLSEAKSKLPNLEIVTLGVFANNIIAISLYKKFGFRKFGKLPQGIVYKNSFVDYEYMFKKVR